MMEKQPQGHDDNSDYLREENLQLPANLDEQSIAQHLRMISRVNPQQLPATVQAVREKWAFMVGGWVERGRLEYLKIVLEQLDVSQAILMRCLSMEDEWSNHHEKKARRGAKAAAGTYALEAEAEAEELRARIARAKTEQADARRRQADLEHPATPAREMTNDERRKQKFKDADDDVNRLVARRDKVLSEYLNGRTFEDLPPRAQEEYRADENMYNDRIRQAKERRMQFE